MAKHTQRSFFVKYYSKAFSTLPGIAGGLAEELDGKGRVLEEKIQDIPANELGTDADQLAEELLREFSRCVAPDRLN